MFADRAHARSAGREGCVSHVKDYGFCVIYVRGGDRQAVTALVAVTLVAEADEYNTVRSGRMEFEIRRNPDAGLADGFIGWPFRVEAESGEASSVFVEAVSRVLRVAWDRGFDAVAACDFEDELPELGGLPR
jgi:hypothetical protein